MEGTHLDPHAKWQYRPLCCNYLLAHFAAQPIQALVGGVACSRDLTWVLGALRDGQREVLGVWLHSIEDVLHSQAVFHDLSVRGVERIRFVVGADANALQAAQPDATVLTLNPQQGSANFEPPSTLSTRLRRIVKSAQEQAGLMQDELGRLIRRHGPFESAGAASGFLERSLERMDRRFWTCTPVRARSAHRHSEAEPLAAAL